MEHVKINKLSECCGCNNCKIICPQKAIRMIENEEGFYYPHVDENKCIKCGLCKKICPWLNKVNREAYLNNSICYAAKSKMKEIQHKSSSGGLFAMLANKVIENNGLIVGSEMDFNHKVKHVIVEKKEDLEKIMGSKYVYSALNNIFVEIRKNLNKGKLVLFSGVPCQISALLKYLQKPYDNLITVEVICHGTPSQKLFDKYVKYLEEKNKSKLVSYKFRSKDAAKWGTFKALALFDNKKEKIINADFDPYYWSFLYGKNYRESCYECKFATSERNADITLGDFWGIEKIKPRMIDYEGVSVVIINSKKGLHLFESISEKLDYEKVYYEDIQRNNGQLKQPSKRPIERSSWYEGIDKEDFIAKIKINSGIKSYIKAIFPQKLKFIAKKIISK